MKKKILIAVGLAMLMLLFISSAFAAHEHTFGDWVWPPGKMPTCQKKGQQERVCTQTGCSKHEYRPVNTVPHEFDPATCTKPKTCKFKCGTTLGSAPGHKFTIPANCVRKKTCSVCGATEGDLGNHIFSSATCIKKSTCIYCGYERGGYGAHKWVNYTCTVCGKHP